MADGLAVVGFFYQVKQYHEGGVHCKTKNILNMPKIGLTMLMIYLPMLIICLLKPTSGLFIDANNSFTKADDAFTNIFLLIQCSSYLASYWKTTFRLQLS